MSTRRIWKQQRCHQGRPEIGHTASIDLEIEITDDSGEPTGPLLVDDPPVTGTAVAIGEHWSDQPHGREGWWVLYEVEAPNRLDGRRLWREDV